MLQFPTLPTMDRGSHLIGLMSVKAFCRWAGIGKSKFYKEIRDERLNPSKVGSRTMVTLDEAERWRSALPGMRRTLSGIPGGSQR